MLKYSRGVCFLGVLAFAAVAVSPTAYAELTEVTDAYQITVSTSGNGVTVATPKVSEWPDDLPTPIFWLDCSQTNGWKIVRGADGTNYVAEIPSLVGDGRFLTTNITLEGTSFTGWWGTTRIPLPPMLVDFDDLPGGPALDFGPFASYRGMMFNPHLYESVGAKKNLLAPIGSMVAVWGSQNGGGYILGGGNNTSTSDIENYRWTRGSDDRDNNKRLDIVPYYSAVLGEYSGTIGKTPGFYMHDGVPASGTLMGMNGRWEAIGFSADAATCSATGLGLGDTRTGYARNGGCRIAEIAIFGETLTQEQMRRAQVFLRRKWLNEGTRGWNGEANLGQIRNGRSDSATYRAVVDVPAGETMTVQKLEGGRKGGAYGSTAVVKTGDGTLKIGDAASYSAPVELRGGTLSISRKRAPETVAELPYGLWMRFDASVQDSMVLYNRDGTNFVARMDNLASGKYLGKDIFLSTCTNLAAYAAYTDREPWLSNTPFGAEKPIVDFGVRTTGQNGGKYFCFFYDDGGTAKNFRANSCGTLVGVFSAHRGGGHVGDIDSAFARYDRWPSEDSYTTALLKNMESGPAKIANTNSESRIFINGQRIDRTSGFQHRGCQVVAYAVQPTGSITLGSERATTASGGEAAGGLMFGELLYWDRPLSDDELMDAQAYLSKKWLGEDLPGYSGAVEGRPDFQTVNVALESTIDVPAGHTNKIGRLVASAPFEKTGGGVLEVGPGSDLARATVREGELKSALPGPEVSEQCCLAKGAALHLDSSNPDTLELVYANGTNFVKSWHSPNGLMAFLQNSYASRRPWLNNDPSARLNGYPVVDFGKYSGSSTTMKGCCYLHLIKSLDSVRAAFIVRGSQEGGGSFLGETAQVTDYCRSGNMAGGTNVAIIASASAAVTAGDFYLDGVKTNCTRALPTGGYEIVDVHPAAGTHVSALALYKASYMMGGQRLAEVVLYERPLTEREKVATRNYLVRKWFPERELQPLPEEESLSPLAVAEIDADGVTGVDAESDVKTARLAGAGTVDKTGDAELSVFDMSDFSGRMNVKGGTLALTGARRTNDAELVTSGRILHLDATWGLTVITNADLTLSVTNWESRAGGGWAAVPGPSLSPAGVICCPTLLENEKNFLPAVKMRYRGWNDGQEYFLFAKDGVTTRLDGIKSVFWVIGSQEGGSLLMGGGVNPHNGTFYPWHRNGEGTSASHELVRNYTQVDISGASWRKNFDSIDPYRTGLSGGYDLLSMVMKADATAANADGLTFDGRMLNGEPSYRSLSGHQRICELIVYDRVLTDEEREKVENYLGIKWGFAQKSATNSASVALSPTATLVAEGQQYVDAISGVGGVDGDVIVRVLERDCADEGVLSVSGTLSIAENPVIRVLNLPQSGTIDVVIAEATAFSGTANLAGAVLDGVPANRDCRVSVRGNRLVLRENRSLTVLIR